MTAFDKRLRDDSGEFTGRDKFLASWTRFWFGPIRMPTDSQGDRIGDWDLPRIGLALTAICFFVSAWADADFWYANGGLQSSQNVARFVHAARLEAESAWSVSPMYLFDSAFPIRVFLIAGVGAAVAVASGRGGRTVAVALWLIFVCLANRQLLLSGIGEKVLSMGLFALGIGPSWGARDRWAFFGRRLMAVQITLFALGTFLAMASRPLWWGGLGAFGLAAPSQIRAFDLTETVLAVSWVYESITLFLLFALPLGSFLAWRQEHRFSRIGVGILVAWAVVVAVLGSHWIYAGAFLASVFAIRLPAGFRCDGIRV